MSGETLRRTVKIANPSGLHLRPITAFVQRALQFQGSVTVTKDGKTVNGKSSLELMLLAAEQGTELILEVSGSDAAVTIEALAEILAAPNPDELPNEPSIKND
jgi:phosphocarrier protein HPr